MELNKLTEAIHAHTLELESVLRQAQAEIYRLRLEVDRIGVENPKDFRDHQASTRVKAEGVNTLLPESKKKLGKVLIANRGELACRGIKVLRSLGIPSVAVYNDADRFALHVQLADESVSLGESENVADTYRSIEAIMAAVEASGADSVYPGYGMLSEDPDFVRACDEAGVIFIGPSAEAMDKCGDKGNARKLVSKFGMTVTPGVDLPLKEMTPEVGYQFFDDPEGGPFLWKVTNSGGGKGNFHVDERSQLEDQFAAALHYAKGRGSNARIIIEKKMQEFRHIEIQVLGDVYGNVKALDERDCSVQRLGQKVIEVAPSYGLTDEQFEQIEAATEKTFREVKYVGAATVEGLLVEDVFYFMEINTRLQVEHPVTEERTGLDLVVQQLKVAAGEALDFPTPERVGCAIEVRLTAERFTSSSPTGFFPSTGKITLLESDLSAMAGVRTDWGYRLNNDVTSKFDSLLGKVITYGRNRTEAIDRMIEALSLIRIEGVHTNKSALIWILNQQEFRQGPVNNRWYSENLIVADHEEAA